VKRLLAGPFKPIEPKLIARTKVLSFAYDEPPPNEEFERLAKKSYPVERLLKLRQRGEKLPTARSYPITVWTFGNDLAMVFLTDEVVVDFALRMKREFDGRRLWINAYSNSVSGYVASDRLIKNEGGYEVNNSLSAAVSYGRPERVQPTVEQRIVECVRSLLPEEFRRPAKSARR